MATSYVRDSHGPRWFVDFDGVQSTSKHYDSTLTYELDLADMLGADTIATAVWEMFGPTKVSESNTTTTATVQISGSGDAELTLTLASGDTKVLRRRWKAVDSRRPGYSR